VREGLGALHAGILAMRNWVNEWVQEGRLWIWRYANPRSGYRGWHFTADPAGCRSVRNLMDRMHGGEPTHRTLQLERVTDAILSVPNYAHKLSGRFENLRINYQPAFDELNLSPEGEKLVMNVGPRRLRKLTAAFSEVEVGLGDFGIDTSDDRKADPWMFWWMPREAR
jgi:hypothetical protein